MWLTAMDCLAVGACLLQEHVESLQQQQESAITLRDQLRDRQDTIVAQDRQIVDLQGALAARDSEVERMHQELAALRSELRNREVRPPAVLLRCRHMAVW